MAERPRSAERVRLTRGARLALAVAFATAGVLGYVIVRTFRSPALEAADVPLAEETLDTGREEVPPQATMPGAPDSGWMAAGGTEPAAGGVAPARGSTPAEVGPAGTPQEPAPAGAVRSYTPSAQSERARRRTYTDADLRALAAARGTEVTRDHGYILALRQRRVEDLSARLAGARSAEERLKLQAWLDGAMRDLERARRE